MSPTRLLPALLLPWTLLGCASDEGLPLLVEPVAFCEGELAYVYDPAEELTTWPDDWWTEADPSTSTGLRLHIDPDDPAVSTFPDEYDNLLVDLGSLDGFGLSPELVL